MSEFQLDERYEYRTYEKLTGLAARYIKIPSHIILDTDMASHRVSVFSYLSIHKGLNDRMLFSIPVFLEWAGYKSDTHAGGINDKILETLDYLSSNEYVTYINECPTRTSSSMIEFNTQLVFDDCFGASFAILYIDEIMKIMRYRNNNPKDRYLNCNTVLLVFAFLRHAIFRTPNILKPEERYPDGVKKRKERCIEAYNGQFKDIGEMLGLSERIVSKSVKILEDLGLILSAEAYHIKNEKDEYRTQDIIFANMEKREGDKLLAKGFDYAWGEIERKEKRLQVYNVKYKLKPTNYVCA